MVSRSGRGGELGGERVELGRGRHPGAAPAAAARSTAVGAPLVEPGRGGLGEGQLGDVGQRRPAPERQRLAEEACA